MKRQPTAGDRQPVPLILAAIICVLLATCKRKPWVPEVPPKPTPEQVRQAHINQAPDDSSERQNLLNITRGAAVVDRTAELLLDNSALRAIDGDPRSDWISPISDPQQTFTLSLGAPSRIDHVGIASTPRYGVKTVEFETSMDGSTFAPLASHTFERRDGVQIVPVPPVDALFMRATTKENFSETSELATIIARGKEIAPPPQRTLGGCWNLNSGTASFADQNGTTRGFLDFRERMWLEGGFDGRVWRFVWLRGPQFGLIAMSASPDSEHISGLKFYIDADPDQRGEDLLGDRLQCSAAPVIPPSAVLRTYLDRHGYVPFYGLHFDAADQLFVRDSDFALNQIAELIKDTAPRRATLISRELRGANAAADHAASQKRLDSLEAELKKRNVDLSRVKFVAKGRDDYRTAISCEVMRTLQSAIEMEIARP